MIRTVTFNAVIAAGLVAFSLNAPATTTNTMVKWNLDRHNLWEEGHPNALWKRNDNMGMGIEAQVSGWTSGEHCTSGTPARSNCEFYRTTLEWFGNGNGMGVGGEASSNGEHAIDNFDAMEFMLWQFEEPVALTDVKVGWPENGNSDMSILAYTGNDPFSWSDPDWGSAGCADGVNKMACRNSDPNDSTGPSRGLTNSGWELIGDSNYENNLPNMYNSENFKSIQNDGEVYSSLWLIGTYNHFLSNSFESGPLDIGDDRIKLLAVKGNKCLDTINNGRCEPGTPPGQVNEPATFMLLSLGLVGMQLRRRRNS